MNLDRDMMNRIATGLAIAGALLALASALPTSAALAGTMAALGLALVAGASHVARPERDEPPRTEVHVLGLVAAAAVGLAGLTVIAGLLARSGAFLLLGGATTFLAEHFAIVTGPLTIVYALVALGAARGEFAPQAEVQPWRRAVTGPLEAVVVLLTLFAALGVLPGEAWHAPYYVAIGLLLLYLDAVWHLGLPTPARMSAAIEEGEAGASIKKAVSFGAYAGNGTAAALAAVAILLGALGNTSGAAAAALVAIALLVASTNATSLHRKVTPLALEEDPQRAREQMTRMRIFSWVLIGTAVMGAIAGFTALSALGSPQSTIAQFADYWPYAIGLLLMVGAGINLARAKMPSRVAYSAGRRAATTIVLCLLATTAFFAQLQSQHLIEGPIAKETLAPGLHLLSVALALGYVMVRGLYPAPIDILPTRTKRTGEKAPETPEDARERMKRTMLTVYITAGAFLVLSVGLLSAIAMGAISLPTGGAPEGNAAFFAVIAIGLLMLVGLAAMFLQSRRIKSVGPDKVQFKRRRTTEEVVRYTMLGLSITIAAILALIGALVMAGQVTTLGPLDVEKRFATDFFVFGLLVGLGPAGFLYNRERARIRAIDQRLPDFLRDLAESQRSGMTLTQAVSTSATGNYGELTPEIRKMAHQIEWGVSFEEAFIRFAKRVNTPLVQRSVSLVVEASKAGGNVVDILTAASDDARELYQIQTERRSSMATYVIIIYVAFFVFLGVIGVLNAQFMPEVSKAVEGAKGAKLGSITFQPFDLQAFRTLFFHAAIVQGFGGGFVAGAMEEGRPVAGLRHSFILTIIAYVAFRTVIGG